MKKLVSLFLVCTLLLALPLFASCKKEEDEGLTVRIWTLNGTTGFGMAPLIAQSESGEAEQSYEFTVESDPTNVRNALLSEDADIAALPTNVASVLYNATDGEIVLLALNTRGVLYLVTNTGKATAPASLADLAGKTVYCPAQNPTFITNALLQKAGVQGVTVDCESYASPELLRNAVASGEVAYAVLPEPMVTVAAASATQNGVTLSVSLDLTAEWDKHFTPGSLVQGCVVARKAFVEENPEAVALFLEEYERSITFVNQSPAEAAEMIVAADIFAKAPIAKTAIPKCNIDYIDGAQMKAAMQEFLSAMPKASIGGALPGDDFYYNA